MHSLICRTAASFHVAEVPGSVASV